MYFKSEKEYRNLGFYMLALVVITFLGFYKTYIGLAPHLNANIDAVVHFHAAASMFWILLLVLQPLLIRSGNYRWHRLLGKSSYIFFPVLILTFLLMMQKMWARGEQLYLFFPLGDMTLLLIFYIAAIINKHRTPVHMRFMIANALVLLDPTLGRMVTHLFNGSFLNSSNIPFLITDLILIGLIYRDKVNRRNYKPYLVALSCFWVYQIAFYLIFLP